MLEVLKNLNKIPIYSVNDTKFNLYGRVVNGYDYSELNLFMEKKSIMPIEGNVYFPSIEEMENTKIYKQLKNNFYGGMDIEIGYCNGMNSTLNGLEFHKGSEINFAVTDFVLILGHSWDIKENKYNVNNVEVFYVKKGEAIEMYDTTLHLSPCKVSDEGFKGVVILPRGTNTELEEKFEVVEDRDRLLLMKNKWVIAHPERKPLIDKGAFPGIIGENLEILYK